MADPWLDAANQTDPKGPTAQQDEWLRAADRAIGAARKTVKIGGKVARQAGENILGATTNFLGSALATPVAYGVHALSGNKTPVTFSPTSDVEQFREVTGNLKAEGFDPGISPELLSIAASVPMASGLNLLGRGAFLPASRAIANAEIGGFRTRAIPSAELLYHGSDAKGAAAIERQGFLGGGPRDTWMIHDRKVAERYASEKGGKVFAVKKSSMDPSLLLPDEESAWRTPGAIGVGSNVHIPLTSELERDIFRTRNIPGIRSLMEALKPGSSLPNKYRDSFYRTLADVEGRTDWRAFLRRRALEEGQRLPREAQNAIADAIETHTVGNLPDGLQGVAKRVITENRNMIADRLQADMARAELSGGQGYVSRILTPEGRKGVQVPAVEGGTRPLSPYGEPFDQGRPALGTSLGKERTEAGRILTTREMSQGKPKFLPSVEATLVKGAQNDRSVMHARIIQDLDRKFGRNLMPGDTPIGSIQGVPAGFNPATKARLMQRALPPEVHEVVARMNQTFQPEEWSRTSEFVRQMNDFFRKTALFSPGFISRNMQNNVIQTAIFGNRDPRNWTWAFGLRNKIRTGAALTPVETEEVKLMVQNGVLSRGFLARETGAGSKFDAAFKVARRLNVFGEDVSRMSFWRYNRNKGLSPYENGKRVNDVLFNYSPTFQSRGFKLTRRHVMPFINWQANIPQLAVRTAIERPGSLGMVGKIRATLNEQNATPESYQALPDYMRDEMATAIAKDTWLMPQGFGTSDIGGQVSAVGKDAGAATALGKEIVRGGKEKFPKYGEFPKTAIGDQLASMSYPQWTLLYTAAAGHDPFTGRLIVGGDAWRRYLAGKVPALRIPSLISEIAQKKPGWQGRVVSFLAGVKTYQKPTK